MGGSWIGWKKAVAATGDRFILAVVEIEMLLCDEIVEDLKHISDLQEEGVVLGAWLAKTAGSLLISQLNQAKGRLKPVDKEHLDILLIDGGVHLVEDLDKEVRRKIISCPEDMDPGTFFFWIRVEHQAGQGVLNRKILDYLIVQVTLYQLKIQAKITSKTIRNAGMLPFSGVVT